MRIVFFGTPEFAASYLHFLAEQKEHSVIGVVTQPDRPSGRGLHLRPPPVKVVAEELGLPLFQPESLRDEEFHRQMRELSPDLFVVIAFSILPQSLLEIPKRGSLNLHGSLLPRYRGAAPVQWAVVNGEKESGLTIFLLDAKMDHGPVLESVRLKIDPDETSVELFERMVVAGRPALRSALEKLERGFVPLEQDHVQATRAPKLKKEDGRIDWNWPSERIHNLIRGMQPWPAAWTTLEGSTLRIWQSRLCDSTEEAAPGSVMNDSHAGPLRVKTGDGWLEIVTLQPQNKRMMEACEYWCGLRNRDGLVLE